MTPSALISRIESATEGSREPIRVQLKRTKGWRMPPNTIHVGRYNSGPRDWPNTWGRFGNPYIIINDTPSERQDAVDYFRRGVTDPHSIQADGYRDHFLAIRQRMPELRGVNLACHCPLGSPCHADVLLELANKESGNA